MKKKVGILLGSTKCQGNLFKVVDELANDSNIELFYLLNVVDDKQTQGWKKLIKKLNQNGFIKTFERIIFKLIVLLEYSVLSLFIKRLRLFNNSYCLDLIESKIVIPLIPIFSQSGLYVRYDKSSIKKLQNLKLDLIVRGNAPGIFRGKILQVAKDGIISFHHGDNRWNRGGPPGFWEVFKKIDSTGFIIQRLTEELDGGLVIFRGNLPTRRTYSENIIDLYNESYPFLVKVVKDYCDKGELSAGEAVIPFDRQILKSPNLLNSFSYLFRTLYCLSYDFLNKYVFGKKMKWSVAFQKNSWEKITLRKGTIIKNPKNHFYADPFVVKRDGKTICFVEDYDYSNKKACISAIELFNDGSYSLLGKVIEEDYHMSFPYLIEHNNNLFMIPETSAAKSIRLYKCISFPMEWKFEKELMSDVDAVDTMLFNFSNRWWLLLNEATNGNRDHAAKLSAYSSSEPFSDDWVQHKKNPIIFDSEIGRNAGLLVSSGSSIFRVRQKQAFNLYGSGFSIAKITELNENCYVENEICKVEPSFFDGIKGCHHMHSNGEYTVYDIVRLGK